MESKNKEKKATIKINGNTYCCICGSKVEGGYCDCFVKR